MADVPAAATTGVTIGVTGDAAWTADTATTFTAGGVKNYSAGVLTMKKALPTWNKYTVRYTDIGAAATTNNMTLFTLPAKGVIHAVKIKHSQAFTGGPVSAYTISVGIVGTLAKYASAYDVYQAVSDTAFQLSTTVGTENHGAGTEIKVAAASTGGNLNLVKHGIVDIWVLTSITP